MKQDKKRMAECGITEGLRTGLFFELLPLSIKGSSDPLKVLVMHSAVTEVLIKDNDTYCV